LKVDGARVSLFRNTNDLIILFIVNASDIFMFIVLMNAFVIKLLEYLLIVMLKRPQSKVRVKNQQHFPFSAYILKSYST